MIKDSSELDASQAAMVHILEVEITVQVQVQKIKHRRAMEA